jgi:EAL domain-containing protein (putative c-di-GMP-specific phosphodiesterase class I)
MIVEESDSAIKLLNSFKDIGISLAIDDFGVGYSSLSHLAQFPVDRLKIDRSFVSDVGSDERATAIAKTIIDLGKNLGMTIVAEGVETEEQYRFFRSEGCDEIQGFYFCEPLAAAPFTDRYRQNQVIEAMRPEFEDDGFIQKVRLATFRR